MVSINLCTIRVESKASDHASFYWTMELCTEAHECTCMIDTCLCTAFPVLQAGTVGLFTATCGRGIGVVDAGASTALLVSGAGEVRRHAVHTGVDIPRSSVQAVLSAALLILTLSTVLPTLYA